MSTGDTQPPAAARGWSRERLKGYLVKRYDLRFHMSLILAATCMAGMLASALLLHAGVHDMRWRYPVVVTLAYLTFLFGVWMWLRVAGFVRSSKTGSSLLDGADVPISGGGGGSGGGIGRIGGGLGRGGGTFDGGGASASWAQGARAPLVAMSPDTAVAADAPSGGSDGLAKTFSGLGDIGGGDDVGAIVLVIVLALAIFLATGYLVWMGPEILTEAAFGATLAGGLARNARDHSAAGWTAGVVKKTWWPFAIVLVLAVVFASYAAAHHPGAKTFREVLHAAIAG